MSPPPPATASGIPEGSYSELARLAGPTVLSRLGVMAMGLTDAIVVGHYSSTELGFHALGWAPTSIVLVAGIGLLLGVQVMTARFVGAGAPERTGAVLRRGLSYALALGLLSTVALLLFGPPALRQMGLSPELAAGASAVLIIFSLSLTPYLLADAIWFWLEAQGRPGVPMVAMWIANILNLVLNLWLVPGTSPFPVDGAQAAAWTTLFARILLLAMLAGFVCWWPQARKAGVFARLVPEPDVAREQRRIGYASGASYAIEAGAFASLNFIAAQLGVLAVATWTVIINVAAVVFMVPLGIAAATAVLVARSVGAGSIAAVRRAFRMGLTGALVALSAITLLIFLMPETVARAYSDDPALVGPAAGALLLSCLFFMADGTQVVSANALRARGDIWWPTRFQGLAYVVIMLPLAWALAISAGLGLDGIVWAVVVASLIAAAGLVMRFAGLGDYMAKGDH